MTWDKLSLIGHFVKKFAPFIKIIIDEIIHIGAVFPKLFGPRIPICESFFLQTPSYVTQFSAQPTKKNNTIQK